MQSKGLSLYDSGGLRFWDERAIMLRNHMSDRIVLEVKETLEGMNGAWKFYQVEGPSLTPRDRINPNYTEEDIFVTKTKIGGKEIVMRPETTPSSYVYAKHLLNNHKVKTKLPLCVWQKGKSFRVEKKDGANPAKLRFNEFYQLEFQCIYSKGTMADYRTKIEPVLEKVCKEVTANNESRIVESERLPSYSLKTNDVELMYNEKWTEVCSISTRKDFDESNLVLEIAVGLDRLIEIEARNS